MRHSGTLAFLIAAVLSLVGCGTEPQADALLYTQVVAADQPLASQAGARMLEQGGNAVDAAVAAAFTLSVVRPQSCGIGGGGFMVIHLPHGASRDGAYVDTAVNSREWCPAGVGPDTFERTTTRDASTIGGLAVAVPGSVAGLLHAQAAYGRLDRAAVLQPAIDAANGGFVVDKAYMTAVTETVYKFKVDPSLQTRFPFLWQTLMHEGNIALGDRIVNRQQGAALLMIARWGERAFYTGPIADAIVAAAKESGGVLSSQDLLDYMDRGVSEADPQRFFALGRTFLTMPPPSSGGVALAQALSMLDRRHAGELVGVDEPAFTHQLTECFKLAFADRAAFMADPAFSFVPVARLMSPADLDARAAMIDPDRTFASAHYTRALPGAAPTRDGGTSHVSAVDRWGGACALTQTINLFFGSWVCAEPYGFLLNNEMDDFTTRRGEANAFGLRQSEANAPGPGKRPLSSMTPTIALDAYERVEAVAGASGGPRIITATTQALVNGLLRGETATAAVARPRIHHQWIPDTLYWEPLADEEQDRLITDSLTAKGHTVKSAKGESAVQLIVRVPGYMGDGVATYTAAGDPRKGGTPAGTPAK